MPFKSEAQRAKFYELKKQGKMSQATINEWERDTPKSLPARVTNKKEVTTGGPTQTIKKTIRGF